jgi:type III secretory pathway component EscT
MSGRRFWLMICLELLIVAVIGCSAGVIIWAAVIGEV